MRLLVLSSKTCWRSSGSPSGYATDGGFAFQMRALSELFDRTTLAVPCVTRSAVAGEVPISGHNLVVVPLTARIGSDLAHKLALPFWCLRNARTVTRELAKADGIHAPVPGDVGTLGILFGLVSGKPLFVRYCGNWSRRTSATDLMVRRLLERFGGGKNVVLATGGSADTPSRRNHAIGWIFATTLTELDLRACATPRVAKPGAGPRLITVSRQVREKGTGTLIETLPLIARSLPEVTLEVVGDGEALPEFRSIAERLGLGERVRFHGNVDHDAVIGLLRDADLFCLPSASEGFPKAVLEALACGLPVVATNVSVLPTLVGSTCGVLVDRATPEELSAAVLACLSDETTYLAMSRAAVEVARRYSLESWRDSIGARLSSAWGALQTEARSYG